MMNAVRRGTFTPLQYLEAISNTIGKMKDYFEDETDIEISEESELESSSENTMRNTNTCVVCLNPRLYTRIFLPCRHANCCAECNIRIQEFGQPCPTCLSSTEDIIPIFN